MNIYTLLKVQQKGGVFRITVHFQEWFEKKKEQLNKMRDFRFSVDRAVAKEEYIKSAVSNNGSLLIFVSVFAAMIELFNMFRVLFLTKGVGISTWNNFIYFSFYLSLFLISVTYIVLDRKVSVTDEKRYLVQMGYGTLFLVWQTLFNVHDVIRTNSQANFTLPVMFMAFAAVFMMHPIYYLLNVGSMYVLFLAMAGDYLTYGARFNMLTMVLLCGLIYYQKYRHVRIEMFQRQEIEMATRAYEAEHERFRLTQEQYEIVCRSSQLVTFEWDIRTGSARFSESWAAALGQPLYVPDLEAFIKKASQLLPWDKERILEVIANVKQNVPYQKLEIRVSRKDGRDHWYELRVTTQTDQEGKPVFGIGILLDIMEQKEEITRIRKRADADATGVLNKAAIERYGKSRIRQLREEETFVVLILDLDDFKYVNDTVGHLTGDYVLAQVAACLRECSLPGMCIGRIGGDEFLALLAGTGTLTMRLVDSFAQKVLERVQKIQVPGMREPVQVSIGIAALYRERNMTFEELYQKADKALYESKRAGKGVIKWEEDQWKDERGTAAGKEISDECSGCETTVR